MSIVRLVTDILVHILSFALCLLPFVGPCHLLIFAFCITLYTLLFFVMYLFPYSYRVAVVLCHIEFFVVPTDILYFFHLFSSRFFLDISVS